MPIKISAREASTVPNPWLYLQNGATNDQFHPKGRGIWKGGGIKYQQEADFLQVLHAHRVKEGEGLEEKWRQIG